MTPLPQPTTIDTLISSISMFSTVLLGVLALFLTFIGGIGAFLIWRGEKYLRKAEVDSRAINDFRIQAAESLKKTLEASNAVVKNADQIVTIVHSVKAKDSEFTRLLSRFEQSKTAYSNASQGTVSLFETPMPPITSAIGLSELIKANEKLQIDLSTPTP